jgi:hypothetical protein
LVFVFLLLAPSICYNALKLANMATKLASAFRYNRSRDSDADASDYDFDLTAEEEDLLETLVASASARPSLSISSGPPTETSIASLRPDIAAVLATHASVKSLQAPEIDLNVRQVFRGPEYTDRNDETALPGFAATDASASLDGANDDRDEITAVVAEAERRMRQPVQVGNIRYPDCEYSPWSRDRERAEKDRSD